MGIKSSNDDFAVLARSKTQNFDNVIKPLKVRISFLYCLITFQEKSKWSDDEDIVTEGCNRIMNKISKFIRYKRVNELDSRARYKNDLRRI